MNEELDKMIDEKVAIVVESFAALCKEQLTNYAQGLARLHKREVPNEEDINMSCMALGMCIKQELDERKQDAFASNLS